MDKVRVIFDFQNYISGGIEDIILELPTLAVPRKGESVGFDTDQLKSTNKHGADILKDNRFFNIEDVTWYFSNSKIRDVRIYLENFKD